MEIELKMEEAVYSSEQDILLVGEGDFSFASALAEAFIWAPRLVATSLDTLETVLSKYKYMDIDARLAKLRKAGVQLLHGVDATSMARAEGDSQLTQQSFDRIIFNFPHSGFDDGFCETVPAKIKAHQNLLRRFFCNAASLLKPQGQVHVTHHVLRQPYAKWDVQALGEESGLCFKECLAFRPSSYPGYVNRRGAGRRPARSFPLKTCGTFVFTSQD